MIPVLAGDLTLSVGHFIFNWRISVKFGLGKYYSYLDKGLFIEKMPQICNFSKEKNGKH
jgi:hypothetical protein